jgi:hypothetical protein
LAFLQAVDASDTRRRLAKLTGWPAALQALRKASIPASRSTMMRIGF